MLPSLSISGLDKCNNPKPNEVANKGNHLFLKNTPKPCIKYPLNTYSSKLV